MGIASLMGQSGGGGLKIKSIQRGTITISSGLTATATVNAVDLSKAVLFHNGATSGNLLVVVILQLLN